jgi:hypothetical protein
MNPAIPADPATWQQIADDVKLLREIVYFLLIFGLALLVLVTAQYLRTQFVKELRLTRSRERARFARLSWASAMAETLRDVQAFNILMYEKWFGSVPIVGKILTDNLPNKANEMIVFLSILILMALFRAWVLPDPNSFFGGGGTRRAARARRRRARRPRAPAR